VPPFYLIWNVECIYLFFSILATDVSNCVGLFGLCASVARQVIGQVQSAYELAEETYLILGTRGMLIVGESDKILQYVDTPAEALCMSILRLTRHCRWCMDFASLKFFVSALLFSICYVHFYVFYFLILNFLVNLQHFCLLLC
jgi:hypothetical protein